MDDSPTLVNLTELFRPHRNEHPESTNGDQLSTFLAMFPTQLHYTKPQYCSELWIFWSQNQPSQNNSFSDYPGLVSEIPNPWEIHEKIKSSFSKFQLTLHDFDGLIQFWAPVTTSGRRLLSTSNQPFALNYLGTGLHKHRLCSLKHKFNVDVNKLEVEQDPMIITGAPATAFLNHLPEVVLDLRVHQGCPLVQSALECELVAYIVLPICDPSQRCCVGVLECFMKKSDSPLIIFHTLNEALKGVDLSTYHVKELLPNKTIHGLERARNDIGEALKVVCEAHNLGLAQVWIPYEDKNHVAFSSSVENTRMKWVLALKLVGYCVRWNNGGLDWSYYYYNDASDVLPLKLGEGLVGKTLENHEPHFCKNISKLRNVELLVSLAAGSECSCFVICLRSTYTRDLHYVFEFLWPENRNHDILLSSLLLTLKRCLPSFKFTSGAQLGDELSVVDVENSLGNKVGLFKICEGIRSLSVPQVLGEETRQMTEECIVLTKAKCKTTPISLRVEQQFGRTMKQDATNLNGNGDLFFLNYNLFYIIANINNTLVPLRGKCKTIPISLEREIIEEQYGRTMKEAARNLKVCLSTLKRKCKDAGIYEWQGPNFGKRKVNDQTDTNEEDNGTIQDSNVVNGETNSNENILTIKAEYGDDVIKLYLPISLATSLVAVWEEIYKSFQLNHGTYKLKYHDEDGDFILMNTDKHMRDCIKTSRLSNTTIRLCVVPTPCQIYDSIF